METQTEMRRLLEEARQELFEYQTKNYAFRQMLDKTPYGQFYNSMIDEIVSWHHNLLPLSEAFRIFKSDLTGRVPQPLYFMGTSFTHRNIAQLNGGMNLKSQGSFEVTPDNLDGVIREMSSRTYAFYILQGYEIFETFLLNVFATYYERHPIVLEERFHKLKGSPTAPKSFTEIREHIKRNIGNHADYFEILERNSDFFQIHSRNNIWNKNLRSVARLLASCRNLITHNRMRVNTKLKNYLNSNPHAKDLFFELFDIAEASGAEVVTTSHTKAGSALEKFVEMAELIMRTLVSIDPPKDGEETMM